MSSPDPTAVATSDRKELAHTTPSANPSLSVRTVLPSVVSPQQDLPSPTSAIPTHTHSPPPSLIDPPTVAGITIGVLAAGVLTFCLIGSLVNWLQRRRRNKLRRQLEASYMASQGPHYPPTGGSISGPLPRDHSPDRPFQKHPQDYSPYSHRRDSGKVGFAVTQSPHDQNMPEDNRSITSIVNLIPAGALRSYHSQVVPSPPQDRRLTVFEEDDPSATDHVQGQQQHENSETQKPFKSSLRPRPADLPSSSRPPPPPLQPALNYQGVPRIKVRPPTLEWQPSLRVTSNAHAHQTKSSNDPGNPQPTPALDESLSKPLPRVAPRYPSYVPEYYTSSSPHDGPDVEASLDSGSTATTFESLASADITPPEETQTLSSHTSPIISPDSPLNGLSYPKIPRSVAQAIPRATSTREAPPVAAPSSLTASQSVTTSPTATRRRPVAITTASAPSSTRRVPVLNNALPSGKSTGSSPRPPWSAGCGTGEMTSRTPPWSATQGGFGIGIAF